MRPQQTAKPPNCPPLRTSLPASFVAPALSRFSALSRKVCLTRRPPCSNSASRARGVVFCQADHECGKRSALHLLHESSHRAYLSELLQYACNCEVESNQLFSRVSWWCRCQQAPWPAASSFCSQSSFLCICCIASPGGCCTHTRQA